MIDLERLYDSAHKHLSGREQDWGGFAVEFSRIFSSQLVIYCTPPDNELLDLNSPDELIATTDRELLEKFFSKGINRLDNMFKDDINPLEPFRRTDHMGDDEYRSHETTRIFLRENDVFYFLVVHAILPNGSPLVLFMWRGENDEDYSDAEKQRITLFMRHLATMVCAFDVKPGGCSNNGPGGEIIAFGEKYSLTRTEVSILHDLISGKSLKMIAEESGRTYGTVRWHVQNILAKCQVGNQKRLLSEFYTLIKR